MNDYVIITDVTCDLPINVIEKYNIIIMPMNYSVDDKNYTNYADFREQSLDEFYSKMRNGSCTRTVQLNSDAYLNTYRKYLKQGFDVYGIVFSSGLSGSYNSAFIAAEELSKEFPERKIVITDSLAASSGEGLIVLEAYKNKDKGLSITDNYNYIEKFKFNVAHWFTVDSIEYLRRGGRVSNAAAFAAKVLNIKPVLHVDDNGHLIPVYKKVGRSISLKELVRQYNATVDKSYDTVIITHADSEKDALFVKDLILKNSNPKEIIISNIGTVIGSHSGPGTLALFFKASHR